jgi:hypothetical protein
MRSRTGIEVNVPDFNWGTQIVPEPGHSRDLLNVGDREAVDARSVSAPVTRDPAERHEKRRRIVHEVEQVIEPAAGIGRSPTVKFGLHLRYPDRGRSHDRSAAIRRRVLQHCSVHPFSIPLPPFPMCRAFPGSEYYDGSAPSRNDQRSTRSAQTTVSDTTGAGSTRTVPVFTVFPSMKEEPDSVPAASPRLPRSTSP